MYKNLNSKLLCETLGAIYGSGKYKSVTRWLEEMTLRTKPALPSRDDVVVAVDNDQKHGRTFTSKIKSKLHTSTICVVIGFILKFYGYTQYIIGGKTSNWRFPEKELTDVEKKKCFERAVNGREPGKFIKEFGYFTERNEIIDKFIDRFQTALLYTGSSNSNGKKY